MFQIITEFPPPPSSDDLETSKSCFQPVEQSHVNVTEESSNLAHVDRDQKEEQSCRGSIRPCDGDTDPCFNIHDESVEKRASSCQNFNSDDNAQAVSRNGDDKQSSSVSGGIPASSCNTEQEESDKAQVQWNSEEDSGRADEDQLLGLSQQPDMGITQSIDTAENSDQESYSEGTGSDDDREVESTSSESDQLKRTSSYERDGKESLFDSTDVEPTMEVSSERPCDTSEEQYDTLDEEEEEDKLLFIGVKSGSSPDPNSLNRIESDSPVTNTCHNDPDGVHAVLVAEPPLCTSGLSSEPDHTSDATGTVISVSPESETEAENTKEPESEEESKSSPEVSDPETTGGRCSDEDSPESQILQTDRVVNPQCTDGPVDVLTEEELQLCVSCDDGGSVSVNEACPVSPGEDDGILEPSVCSDVGLLDLSRVAVTECTEDKKTTEIRDGLEFQDENKPIKEPQKGTIKKDSDVTLYSDANII